MASKPAHLWKPFVKWYLSAFKTNVNGVSCLLTFCTPANRMAAFPRRDRDAFRAHWTKILADQAVIKKTILFEGGVAGNVVIAWILTIPTSALIAAGAWWLGRQLF